MNLLTPPKKATLSKYGLSMEEWERLAAQQGHVCFICQNYPKKGRLCVDHFHIKGWKKMPPEQRKLYVRGLLCWFCNHYYVSRGITIEKSMRTTLYLENFKNRMP